MIIIDETEKEAIRKVVIYAENHPLTTNMLKKINEGKLPCPSNVDQYTCKLKNGIKCVFTIDQAIRKDCANGEDPHVWCRHLSVSSSSKMPSPKDVDYLLDFFGYKHDLCEPNTDNPNLNSQLMVWQNQSPYSIHIIEQIEC